MKNVKIINNLPPLFRDFRTGECGNWQVWMEHSPYHLAVDKNNVAQVRWQFRIEIEEQ